MTEPGNDDLGLDDLQESAADDLTPYIDFGLEDATSVGLQDLNSAAAFDALQLAALLSKRAPVGQVDLHALAYLACLMSVYRGEPASAWGYAFTAVPPTLPYSPAIEGAIEQLISAGHLEVVNDGTDSTGVRYRVHRSGQVEIDFLRSLPSLARRTEFLEAASKTAILGSTPSVINSLSYEPQLAQAMKVGGSRMLLTKDTTGPLYAQFAALVAVLGTDHSELLVPASLYVDLLNDQAKHEIERLTSLEAE